MRRRIGAAVPLCVALLLYASSFELVGYAGTRRLVRGGAVLLALAGVVVYLRQDVRLAVLLGTTVLPYLGILLFDAVLGSRGLATVVFPSILVVYLASLSTLLYAAR